MTVATRRYGGSDLITLDARGKNVARLTKDLGDVNEPAWRPDGRRLAFVVTANGAGAIRLFDVEPAKIASIGSGQNDRGPVWSPDGKQLLFTSNRTGGADLFVMDADGSHVVNLTNHPNGAPRGGIAAKLNALSDRPRDVRPTVSA